MELSLLTASGSRFIGTSNHGFGQYAQEEVRRLIPDAKFHAIVPTEVVLIETSSDARTVIDRIKNNKPMFLRHLQPANLAVEAEGGEQDLQRLRELLAGRIDLPEDSKVAVQARKQEGLDLVYPLLAVKEAADQVLASEYKAETVVRDADYILSIYITGKAIYVGLSSPEDNLSDWSGGAIRFQREDGQVSRAKFKLLEAEHVFGVDFSAFRHALDIGAAPGGWTSLLLERGLKVTAVDPAHLHPGLLDHPSLTFLQKNADEVKFAAETFDLLVCDMSWSPRQMGRLIANLLYALRSGGTAIITVKLMHKKPFQTVRELTERFADSLTLCGARQLFHNREELTLYLVKG